MDLHFDSEKEKELTLWLKANVGLENFRPGRERLEKMIRESRAELERRRVLVVTIGGTNGKGETSHNLSHLLRSANLSYALWTSPHVVSVRERIVLNGECVSYEVLWSSIRRCFEKLSRLGVDSPTYYEFMLMVFMDVLLTSPRPIRFCVLEVGLGGKKDGVNFFEPHLTAITSISRDHESILGKGLKNILGEKLGITRPRAPLITNLELHYCRQLVSEYAAREKIAWLDLFQEGISLKGDSYSSRNRWLSYSLFLLLSSMDSMSSMASPPSAPQECLDQMIRGKARDIRESVRKISFPLTRGRSDLMTLGRTQIKFVGAHNVDGMRKLKHDLDARGDIFDLVLLSFSRRSLQEMRDLVRILLVPPRAGKKIVVTSFDHDRAAEVDVLQQLIPLVASEHVVWHPRWEELLMGESEGKKTPQLVHDKILVAGSYYFVGTVEAWLLGK